MQWVITMSKTAIFETDSTDNVQALNAGMLLLSQDKYDCKSINLELVDKEEK